ncbi:MAG: LuxR C-terminal-related transcriptional regulator [Actinomycetia bacterium]|nr:LuxR C-terminal-related transcriptional regulator [Actinomycetes bacterium]
MRDAGSQNGVRVNGLRISSATTLQPGDGVALGGTHLRIARDGGDSVPALVTQRAPVAPTAPAALTPRERELVRHLAAGLTDLEISERMTISIRTVRSHLDRIRDKTGARRRPDLTRLALDLGLLTAPGATS